MNCADLQKLLDDATPGPWCAEFDARTWGWADVVADGFRIGWPTRATDLNHRDFVSRQANARLIALAPDLARKVIAAEKLAEALRDILDMDDDHWAQMGAALAEWDATQ